MDSYFLADPSGPSSLVLAVQWIQGTLLGTIATATAVIMVASIGLMMLTGRVDIRRGVSIIFGCFVLFGAPSIGLGIMSAVGSADVGYGAIPHEAKASPLTASTPFTAGPDDPYAGSYVNVDQRGLNTGK